MEWNLLTWAQLLFFGLGAWYFWRSSRRKGAGEGLRCEDNIVEMDKLMAMEETKLTEPLAEQTRPRTLEEIIGQENGIKALRAALCGPNPQHILIYGPPGVGKTAAARLILEEAKKREGSPFGAGARFVEIDATTLQFDERNIADPLLGSVHDPIYQGAGAFGNAGIPRPRPGAVCEAHGGVLFIDEIGELHPVQMNKLLKVLEDRVAHFQSSYYSSSNKSIPPYIHQIFRKGMPADFRLIGATTRSPQEIPEALRSRCTEIFFEPLDRTAVEKIAENSLRRAGVSYEEGLCGRIAAYAGGGRDAVNLVQSLTSLAWMEGKKKITARELEWAAEAGRYQPLYRQKIAKQPQVGAGQWPRDAAFRRSGGAEGRQWLNGDGHRRGGRTEKRAGNGETQEQCPFCGGECAYTAGTVRLFCAGFPCASEFPRRGSCGWALRRGSNVSCDLFRFYGNTCSPYPCADGGSRSAWTGAPCWRRGAEACGGKGGRCDEGLDSETELEGKLLQFGNRGHFCCNSAGAAQCGVSF